MVSKKFLKLVSILCLGLIGFVWLFKRSSTSEELNKKEDQKGLMSVATLFSVSSRTQCPIVLYGETVPSDVVVLFSPTVGFVEKINTSEGQVVSQGTLLVTLTPEDKKTSLASAEATVAKARKKYENAKLFFAKKIISEVALQDAQEILSQAESQWEQAHIAMDNRFIRAPSEGLVLRYDVRKGTLLQPMGASGSKIGIFLRLNPLKVRAHVTQFDYKNLHLGQKIEVRLANGETATGELTYLGKSADLGTRTFQIDVTIDNPNYTLPAGLSAKMFLPRENVEAHHVSSDMLSLTDEGVLGVKALNEKNEVVFYPVRLLASDEKGVSIAGLPSRVMLISRGQDFVKPGDKVVPHVEQRGV